MCRFGASSVEYFLKNADYYTVDNGVVTSVSPAGVLASAGASAGAGAGAGTGAGASEGHWEFANLGRLPQSGRPLGGLLAVHMQRLAVTVTMVQALLHWQTPYHLPGHACSVR